MGAARVGANLLWLVPGVVGGSEDYSVRLLQSYADQTPRPFELTLFVNQAFGAAHPELVAEFPTVVAPVSGGHKGVRVVAESTWLARQARAERMDLVHHLGGTMPTRTTQPGVVTVHDLQPFANPEHFSRIKRAYLHATVPTSVRRAALVVTLSEFTRHDVCARIGIDPGRVAVVPPGLDERARPAPERCLEVREKYGLDEHAFFLYPAITYPHKNHGILLEAFAGVARVDPDVSLLLTSGQGGAEPSVRRTIERLGLTERVRRLGRVPRADLDALFATATALVFPSRYEGFGLPVIEAMSLCCPVIASSATALPEVVGDAALLVDPDDTAGWTAAMLRMLDGTPERGQMVARGVARAGAFSWAASARALGDAWQTALDAGARS